MASIKREAQAQIFRCVCVCVCWGGGEGNWYMLVALPPLTHKETRVVKHEPTFLTKPLHSYCS